MRQKSIYIFHFIILLLLVLFILFVPVPYAQAKTIDFTDPAIFTPVNARISFYTSSASETDSTPEIAANGQNIWELHKTGSSTCASNRYKFGTIIYIPDIGFCIVRDRMNRRFDDTFQVDYYMGYDKKRAKQSGIQHKRIKVFKKM